MPEPEDHPPTQPEREEDQRPPPLPAGLADERFAANIREQREHKKLSQGELARRMAERGFPYYQQTVRRIEDGHRKVSVGEAQALAEILGTTMELLTWPGREASTASLLADFTHRAGTAWEQAAAWTSSLLHAQRQLASLITGAEKNDYLRSAEIRKLAAEAREAMKLTAAEALALGEREHASMTGDDEDFEPECPPPLLAEDGR